MNLRDVRMVQRGQRPGLAFEPRQPFRVVGEMVGQYLDGHLAPERRVLGAIHLSHAARAEWGDHFVGTETRAWGQGHIRRPGRL